MNLFNKELLVNKIQVLIIHRKASNKKKNKKNKI